MKGVDSIHVWWLLRACGRRNPLVRTSDRIELLVIAFGVLIALVATACAGALGTAVHDARSDTYLAEARTRHTVPATAIEDSTTFVGVRDNVVARVNARWQVDGSEHTGALLRWIPSKLVTRYDLGGRWWRARRCAHTDIAGRRGRGRCCLRGLASGGLRRAGLVCWGRSRLDRRRISGWEREIRSLVYGGGSGNRKT